VPGIPSIVDWLRIRLEDDDLADLAPGTVVAPADARARALDVLDQLAADHTPKLCHGDLSPWNVLADQHKGWSLIDPRGVSGEVHYDIAVLGLKIARTDDPIPVVALLARTIGVAPHRAHAWLTVASACRV